MEWIIVDYPFVRDVFIGGELCGRTNRMMAVGPGTQRIDLGEPVDYTPRRRTVTVSGTSRTRPREIAFTPL
jgi:hypothetical protein